MTKGITSQEPNPREVYADIIDLPHHESDHHPPMSPEDRAAQFAPYAALSGYHDLISEEARLVDSKIELSEDAQDSLERKLNLIQSAILDGMKPEISITCFIPDPRKAGGRYETVTEKIRKVDSIAQRIILDRKTGLSGSWQSISFADILDIHSDLVDSVFE